MYLKDGDIRRFCTHWVFQALSWKVLKTTVVCDLKAVKLAFVVTYLLYGRHSYISSVITNVTMGTRRKNFIPWLFLIFRLNGNGNGEHSQPNLSCDSK